MFVSSRMEELRAERAAIRAALAESDVDAFVFEADAGARPYSAERTYLEEAGDSDIYVGVFWKGYGPHTIRELEYASSIGLDCLVYERRADVTAGRDPALQAVLDRFGDVEGGLTIGSFESVEELASAVKRDVARLLARRFRETKEAESTVFHGVPGRVPTDFVGRRPELGRMVRALRAGRDLAIDGLPGVGKTTLALALAHHAALRRHFRDGVLWASLGPRADAAEALTGWARALERAGILSGDVTRLPFLADRTQAVRDAIGRRRMLFVIDDVWEPEAGEALRCGGPACAHVVTTRDREVAQAFAGAAHAGTIAALEEPDAWELLERIAPDACRTDPGRARDVVRAVGGLPQALRLIGGYLAQPAAGMFASVFTGLHTGALDAMSDPVRRLVLAEDRLGSRSGAKITLEETIRLSLHDLPDAARQAFASLGAFAAKPERFTPEAASAVTQADGGTLALLGARNLIEVDTASRSLSLHPTIADAARRALPPDSVVRHREHYLAEVRASGGDSGRIAAVYGQLRWAWQQAPDDDTLFVLFAAAASFQEHRGLAGETLAWAERAVAVAEKRNLAPVTARLLGIIGDAEKALGRYDQALTRYGRELAIWESLGEHDWRCDALLRTAHALGRLGRHDEALTRAADAGGVARATGNRAKQAQARVLRALLLRDAARDDEAIQEAEEAHAELRELSDRDGEADCLLVLATIHRRLGQHEQALEHVRAATALRAETRNESGEAEARLLAASVAGDRGHLEEALAAAREACDRAEASGPRQLFLDGLGVTADLLLRLGRLDEARTCYERQLEAYHEIDDRAGRAAVLRRIAKVHAARGHPGQERAALEEALAIYRELGNRAEQALTLEFLRLARSNRERPDVALACLREAAGIWAELGQAPARARVLADIGAELWALEEHDEAIASYAAADAIFDDPPAGSDPFVAGGPLAAPLVLALGTTLARWLAGGAIRPLLLRALNDEREAIRSAWGVLPPRIIVADRRRDIPTDSYIVELHAVPLVTGTLYEDERLWPGPAEELAAAGCTGRPAAHPATGEPAAWVGREDWPRAARLDRPLWTALEYVCRHVHYVARTHLHELLGHQQTMDMVAKQTPGAAETIRSDPAALTALVLVLRSLLDEAVPIRALPEIVRTFLTLHAAGRDRLAILGAIRLLPAVRDQLPGNVAPGTLFTLPAAVEAEIRAAIDVVDGLAYLVMPPARTQRVLSLVRACLSVRTDAAALVVLDAGIRRFVRRIVELEFPNLQVVSREELLPARERAILSGGEGLPAV